MARVAGSAAGHPWQSWPSPSGRFARSRSSPVQPSPTRLNFTRCPAVHSVMAAVRKNNRKYRRRRRPSSSANVSLWRHLLTCEAIASAEVAAHDLEGHRRQTQEGELFNPPRAATPPPPAGLPPPPPPPSLHPSVPP